MWAFIIIGCTMLSLFLADWALEESQYPLSCSICKHTINLPIRDGFIHFEDETHGWKYGKVVTGGWTCPDCSDD